MVHNLTGCSNTSDVVEKVNYLLAVSQHRDTLVAEESVSYAETRPPVLWTGKTKCGRVLICLDGQWTGKKNLNSYVSCSPIRRTAQSALRVMLLS